MDYGDKMTKQIQQELEKEIAAFDSKATLADIERNAIGGPDLYEYEQYVENSAGGVEVAEANPDIIEEQNAIDLRRGTMSPQVEAAKEEIREILSYREYQVWRHHMRGGLSVDETADLMNLSSGSIRTYVNRAIKKVREHFGA